ncbi:MAG: LysM peptidoglycan-binding domain-containing protein [Anaerolineae bacterium]|nr:LysM peptidoglycan-binding domain-containing protein [Anaerolineae bacterium]
MAACDLAAPDSTLDPTQSSQATLLLRTVSHTVSPPPSVTPRASGAITPVAQTPANRTPRPAATPTYYTVTAGDTLASIAARFSITVRALQEANDGLPPDLVIPGQVLLIPLPVFSTPPDLTQTLIRYLPTSTPLPLPLAEPACYPTPAAELICLGWVRNPFDDALTDVAVAVALRDPAGGVLIERAVGVVQALVPPRVGAPYAVRFSAPPEYASVAVRLVGAAVAGPDETSAIVALEVREQSMQAEGDLVRVRGITRVPGDAPLFDVIGVAVLFNATDHVTGYRALRLDEALAPGDEWPIDLLITPLAPGAVRLWLYGEGRVGE